MTRWEEFKGICLVTALVLTAVFVVRFAWFFTQ
jgi:hypothetical protein